MKTYLPPFNLIQHLLTLDLTTSELKVAVALALHRNAQSGRCCPTQNYLAKATATSRSTTLRAITKLVAKRVLLRHRTKRTSANHYFFRFDLAELATNSRQNGNAYLEMEDVINTIEQPLEVSPCCYFDEVSP